MEDNEATMLETFLSKIFIFCWSIVDQQCCDTSGALQSDSVAHMFNTYTYSFSFFSHLGHTEYE